MAVLCFPYLYLMITPDNSVIMMGPMLPVIPRLYNIIPISMPGSINFKDHETYMRRFVSKNCSSKMTKFTSTIPQL